MYTSKPAAAINVPATHMKRARPTEPDKAKIPDGVAKIPVPIILLMILPVSSSRSLEYGDWTYRKTALVRPIVFLSSDTS